MGGIGTNDGLSMRSDINKCMGDKPANREGTDHPHLPSSVPPNQAFPSNASGSSRLRDANSSDGRGGRWGHDLELAPAVSPSRCVPSFCSLHS